jgi:dTDP-4-dehydrorhamnose 3,5-epimerase
MERLETRLEGPVLVRPLVHSDNRGFLQETYRREVFAGFGIEDEFVQDNHSRSRQGIVRGIHYQPGMAKLVRCARGAVLDVVVDLRRGSPTFGEWESFELSDENLHELYVPDSFGHGFCVLSEVADVVYKCSAYFAAENEGGFAYDDPDVGIEWPAGIELIPSKRDANAPRLRDVQDELPFQY